jgi:hypothetical protein
MGALGRAEARPRRRNNAADPCRYGTSGIHPAHEQKLAKTLRGDRPYAVHAFERRNRLERTPAPSLGSDGLSANLAYPWKRPQVLLAGRVERQRETEEDPDLRGIVPAGAERGVADGPEPASRGRLHHGDSGRRRGTANSGQRGDRQDHPQEAACPV